MNTDELAHDLGEPKPMSLEENGEPSPKIDNTATPQDDDKTVLATPKLANAVADDDKTVLATPRLAEATPFEAPPKAHIEAKAVPQPATPTPSPASAADDATVVRPTPQATPAEETVLHPAMVEATATPAQAPAAPVTARPQTGQLPATDEATLVTPSSHSPDGNQTATQTTPAQTETHRILSSLNVDGSPIAQSLLDSLAGETLTASSSLRSDQELSEGVVLKDRFVLKETLGKGGMGTVFKALDLRKVEANDREAFVALKVLNLDFRDNPVSFMALQRETKRAQTLSHPNIITVYDFDRDGHHVFMTMEHLQGRPLSSLIREISKTGMSFKKAWPIIEAMASALAYAHKKNIVHSDFKPGNVFITQQNETKVLDFGIATAIGRPDKGGGDATVFNARDLGAMTPAYASLEQLRQQPPDPRDDLYALACVAYELLTGQHPFRKLSAENALELNLHPKPIPGLKRNQWKALQRGLALKQEDRIASVAEFVKLMQPHSKLFFAAWSVAALAVAATAANVYLHMIAPPPAAPPIAVELSQEQQKKIDDLLELAAIHFEVGYLTAPTGSNALWAYQEVLKIDPYNEKAVSGLKKIADAEEQAAWELYEKGNRAESLKKVMEGLEANPQHEGLLKLKSKLEG